MKLRFAAGLGLFFLLQSSIAEARSTMERLDQLIFGRSKDLSAAYEAYDNGKFEEAAKDFSAYASGPQSNQVATYNAGVASYKAGKPDDAMKFLQRASLGSDPKIKAKALHNTASIHIDKKELEPARDILKEALSYDNDNKAIRENLEWVEDQLKNQPQKKDQDKKDQNQADNKDKKDEQKKEDQQSASSKENDPNKDAQSKDQQKGQDQKSAEEKKAEQDKQNDGKSKEQTAKDEGAKKDEQQKDKEQAQAAQGQKDKDKDQSRDPQKQAQASKSEEGKAPDSPEGKKAQAILTQAELKQQEAERLLRSIDDKIGRYPLTDTEATGQRGKDGKNW